MIPVFFSINNAYAQHLSVAMASILKNSTADFKFHILHNDITTETEARLDGLKNIRRFDLEFIKVDASIFEGLALRDERIPMEACYRCLIPQVKPELDKAIYLDADIVVIDDLAHLWETDIGDNYCGAVMDFVEHDSPERRQLFSNVQYFNSGVLVLNLKRMRAELNMAKFLDIEKMHGKHFIYLDQDLLNIAFCGNVFYLPLKWNVTMMFIEGVIKKRTNKTEEVCRAFVLPGIIHYVSSGKPWIKPRGIYSPYYSELYFYYLEMTPYAANKSKIMKSCRVSCDFLHYWKRHPLFFARTSTRTRRKYKALSVSFSKKLISSGCQPKPEHAAGATVEG